MSGAAVGFLVFLPQLVLYVAFLVVVAVWSRGRVRTLGLVAGVVSLVGAALNAVYNLMIPTLMAELDLPASAVGAFSAAFLVFPYVSLGFIAAALVIGGRALSREAGRPQTSGPTPDHPGPSHPA